MQSRRASPRIPYDEAVCLSRTDGNGRLYGRAMDLGTGGVALVCGEDCPIGTQVRCDVLLPGGPRQIMGRVVRVTAAPAGFELAVSFEDLRPGVAAIIEELIAARTKQAPARVQIEGGEQPLPSEASGDDTIPKIAVDPPAADGVPRLAVDVDLDESPRARTARYGTPRAAMVVQPSAAPANVVAASPVASVAIPPPPTSLPPPFGQPLPSIVIEPALEAIDVRTPATPGPEPLRTPAPQARPRRGAAGAMRGTAVVARRPIPPDFGWQRPGVAVAAPSAAAVAVAPKRASLLDAPLSARALVVWAPIVALVTALLVQLSR
jgi:hypothetical protein